MVDDSFRAPATTKAILRISAGFLGFALFVTTAMAADKPGDKFNILPSSLPAPFATPGVANSSQTIARPQGTMPDVPKGFAISVYASGLSDPRWMALAPNGDVFLAEPDANQVTLLHDGKASVFANGFDRPHGLAFHDGALYVADMDAVWRLTYSDGALSAGARIRITKTGFGGKNGHTTRDIAFDRDGSLYVAIGSANNIAEDPAPRATVQKVAVDGTLSTFASGLRNPVGIVLYPGTNDLYVTVNERDGYGDGLVPDYLTRIRAGDFFGWPYAYTGNHPDPDFGAKRPDLVAKTKTPDILFQSHSAPLGLVFYEGAQFPTAYKGDAFVSLHGSWNAGVPTGYKVVRVKFANGRPVGGYENFVTGFRKPDSSPAEVWGRPAGLLVTKDGSLLIADDVGKTVWQVRYTGK